jgi:hypothetical protein
MNNNSPEEVAAVKIQAWIRSYFSNNDKIHENINKIYKSPKLTNDASPYIVTNIISSPHPINASPELEDISLTPEMIKKYFDEKNKKEFGITIKKNPKTNNFFVKNVKKNSIANEKGILPNDIIQKINDISVNHFSPNQINSFLNTPNLNDITIELLREYKDENNIMRNKTITIIIDDDDDDGDTEKHVSKLTITGKKMIDNYKLMKSIQEYAYTKRTVHWMSSKFYYKRNMYFVIPSVVITSISGVISFLAASDYFNNDSDSNVSTVMTLIVGGLSSLSTLIQSFSNACGYASKAEAHQNAVESYDQLATKVRFKTINSGPEIDQRFITDLEVQVSEIKQRCKYLVPEWIENEYIIKKFKHDSRTILYNAKEKVREFQIENYLKKIKYFSQVSDCSEKNEFYDLESLDKINLNNIGYETGIVKKKWYKFWK